MTAPTPPDGKFATSDEAVARFEGAFPPGRVTQLKWRIVDVENDLMGQVRSLRKPVEEIEADSEAVGDPDRLQRVKSLVIDKVLDLHRNPDRKTSKTTGMDGFSETSGYAQNRGTDLVSLYFSDRELNSVRLPRQRRPKLGTYGVSPAGF